MTRIFGHTINPELLGLWALETMLCFLAAYVLLVPDTAPMAMLAGLHPRAVQAAAVLALGGGVVSVAVGLYRPDVCFEGRRVLLSTAVGAVMAFPLLFLSSSLVGTRLGFVLVHDRLLLLKMLVGWVLVLFSLRVVLSRVARLGLFARPVLVLGEGEAAARARAVIDTSRVTLRHAAPAEATPVGAVVLERAGAGRRDARRDGRPWGVVLGEGAGAPAWEGLDAARARGVHVFEPAEFSERFLRRLDTDRLPADWLVAAERAAGRTAVEDGAVSARLRLRLGRVMDALRAGLVRAMDLAVASLLLLFTLPLMLLTALLVRLDSPGPVFYRQERVGLHGRAFTLTKFRSMRTDAEAGGVPGWAAQRDPRVTRVGRLIRRTRIDELPQLLNVLRGEMSLVGPRPERPHFVEQLTALLPHYGDRARVKPGLTGWAQVSFPYGASVEDARMKLAYDLYYVKHRSLVFDLFILLSTVRVVLFQDGAR